MTETLMTEDLWEAYLRLPPGPRTVLRVKALVVSVTTKTAFLECLNRGGVRTPEGKGWTSALVNAALDVLQKHSLLTADLACVPVLLHPVAMDAAAAPEAEKLFAAARRFFSPSSSSLGYSSPMRRLLGDSERVLLARLAIYANDPDGFAHQRTQSGIFVPGADEPFMRSLGRMLARVAFTPEWLDNRDPVLQAALLESRLEAFMAGDLAIPGVPALIDRYRGRQDRPEFAPLLPVLLTQAILALRLDEARTLLARLQAGTPEPNPAHQEIAATVHFLAGENAEAIDLYRAALKLRRKKAGKRKLFVDGMHGLFFLMALLRANDAAVYPEIQAGIDMLPLEDRPYRMAWTGLQTLLWLAQGLEGKAREQVRSLKDVNPDDLLADAIWRLAAHAVDPAYTRQHAAALWKRFDLMQGVLVLPTRMYAEVLAEADPAPDRYAAYLKATASGIGVEFTHLLRLTQPWERALETLDTLLFAAGRKSEAEP
ncbi:MAG: hypothetical protein ACJ8AI_26205, partial [Rhodopila sp.]